ncbi:MAG: hypothetical protein IK096_01715, partial [Lachnospiraceae bacterium]|nr:hypothetical protein [Lachnospiraceae bacterium]
LCAEDKGAGEEIADFVGITADAVRIPLSAELLPDEHAIELTPAEIPESDQTTGDPVIDEIRYIDSNTYHGALILNQAGLPMAPFRWKITQ